MSLHFKCYTLRGNLCACTWCKFRTKVISFLSLLEPAALHLHSAPVQVLYDDHNEDNILSLVCFLCLPGDYKAAISEHRQELALSEALNDVIGRAVANRKIGECYAEMGNFTAALKVSRSNWEYKHFY